MNRDLFVYDGDCGLCQRTVDWLASRTDASIEFVPAVDAPADLALDPTALNEAAVLVCSDGRRFWGSLAIGETLRRNERYGNNLLGRLILEEPTKSVARWIYRWVARNRLRLSGDGQCRV